MYLTQSKTLREPLLFSVLGLVRLLAAGRCAFGPGGSRGHHAHLGQFERSRGKCLLAGCRCFR